MEEGVGGRGHRRGSPGETAAASLVPETLPLGPGSGQQTILDWVFLGPGSELPIFPGVLFVR